jgi:hypothetical protein
MVWLNYQLCTHLVSCTRYYTIYANLDVGSIFFESAYAISGFKFKDVKFIDVSLNQVKLLIKKC